MTWPSRPAVPGWDKVSAIWARRPGSPIPVKQFPSLAKPISAACAVQATYSCPLRITCAPNGGWPLIDRQVPPGRVHDVEGVVVDELPGLLQVADLPRLRRAGHLPYRRRRPRHQDQKDTDGHRVVAEIVLRDPVLTLPGPAVDHRHPVDA